MKEENGVQREEMKWRASRLLGPGSIFEEAASYTAVYSVRLGNRKVPGEDARPRLREQ